MEESKFPITESKELPETLSGFNPYERGEYYWCFCTAVGEVVAFAYDALLDSYTKLPAIIKIEILTLSLSNVSVQQKITKWIEEVYWPEHKQ